MLTPLRPHQLQAIDMLRAALRQGHRRPCLRLATGSGKTLVSAAICEGAVARELDARHEARALLAFIDGLGLELLCHPQPFVPEQQRELVGRYVRRVLASAQGDVVT